MEVKWDFFSGCRVCFFDNQSYPTLDGIITSVAQLSSYQHVCFLNYIFNSIKIPPKGLVFVVFGIFLGVSIPTNKSFFIYWIVLFFNFLSVQKAISQRELFLGDLNFFLFFLLGKQIRLFRIAVKEINEIVKLCLSIDVYLLRGSC